MKFFDLSSDYNRLNIKKLKTFFPHIEDHIELLSAIQKHKYQNKKIATMALTHCSALVYWPKNKSEIFSNQRLEYLGDSFLNFFITGFSMSLFPHLNEGELSKLRSAIVGSKNLAKKSRLLKIGDCLLLGKTDKHISFNDQDNILADTFEAVTAALLLDAGYTKTAHWLSEIFHDDIISVSNNLTHLDVKGALQNWAQSTFGVMPVYSAIDITKDKREPMFEVSVSINGNEIARDSANTKKEASKKVAKNVMNLIKSGKL